MEIFPGPGQWAQRCADMAIAFRQKPKAGAASAWPGTPKFPKSSKVDALPAQWHRQFIEVFIEDELKKELNEAKPKSWREVISLSMTKLTEVWPQTNFTTLDAI